MASVGSIDIQVGADISNLQQSLRAMQNSLNSAGNNIQRQTRNMARSFSDMANTIKASIVSVVVYKGLDLLTNGIADTVKMFNTLESSSLGLQSILEAQGRSFSQAKGFIDEYVQDGLIPLADAVTSYKNLSARGYNDEQIKNTLMRLKDAAAFGRQSSLSIGEAVKDASEGLRNENSILVDNAGITKNVAKMWEEYADQIGSSRDKLTQQQKIQAEVNGVMKESQFQVGDAARYSETLGGKLSALSAQFSMLQGAIGSIFAPALQAILPFITEAIVKFTILANTMASFSRAIFGTSASQKATTQSSIALGKSQDKVAEGAKKAGKALNDNLQGIDEINNLQKETTSSAKDMADGGEVTTGTTDAGGNSVPEIDLSGALGTWKKFTDMLAGPKKAIDELIKAIIVFNEKAIMPNLRNLGELLGNLFKKAIESELFEKTINVLKESINLLGEVIVANQPLLDALFEVLELLGGIVIDVLAFSLDLLAKSIAYVGETIKAYPNLTMFATVFAGLLLVVPPVVAFFSSIGGVITGVIAIIGSLGGIVGLLSGAWSLLVAIASPLIVAISAIGAPVILITAGIALLIAGCILLYKNWDLVKEKALEVWVKIKESVASSVESIKKSISPITSFVSGVWDSVKTNLSNAWEWIKKLISSAIESIKLIISPITSFISSIWDKVKINVTETFEFIKKVIEPLANFVKEVFDRIGIFVSQAWDIVKAIIKTLVAYIDIEVITPVLAGFKMLWESITTVLSLQWDLIKKVFSTMWGYINKEVILPVTEGFKMLWESVKTLWSIQWEILKGIFLVMWTWIDREVIKPITKLFSVMWEVVTLGANAMWEGIKSVGKLVINGVLTNVEAFVNTLVLAINSLIKIMNKIKFDVPSWVPDIGGQSFGINLQEIGKVNIPKLANGGITTGATVAMIGEGKYDEVVQPLGGAKYDELINGVADAVVSALAISNPVKKDQEIYIYMDGKAVASGIYDHLKNNTSRIGTSLIR